MNDWKKTCATKRRAQASCVIIVETEDPVRIGELIEFVKSPVFESESYFKHTEKPVQRRLLGDPWEGLQQWIEPVESAKKEGKEGKWHPVDEKDSPFPMMQADITASVRTIDQIIKAQTTVVVIKNITNSNLANAISLALQNWAHHRHVLAHKSTVFVVTPDALLFDEHTRRLCVLIEPPFSTEEERQAVLDPIAKAMNIEYEKLIVTASSGMTLHDVETAALESVLTNKQIELPAITKVKMDIMRKYGFELMYPRYGWEAIGGYETLKEYFSNNVIRIIKDDVARSWGVSASRGILMFGIGGTGKTLFAKAMSKELALPFIKVSSADLYKGIVGETERAVKNLQKVAEANAPCIVFVDEIDQIGIRRDMVLSTDSGVGRRATNMLMDWLGDDERQAIIVGATNLIEHLDPAFIRAGRFDEKIPLFPPDFDARQEIAKVHTRVLRKIPLQKDVNMKEIAEKTSLWTGAEIELLCVASARIARSRKSKKVSMQDFNIALGEVTVNVEERQKELKKFRATAETHSSNRRLLQQQLEEFKEKEKGVTRMEAFLKEL